MSFQAVMQAAKQARAEKRIHAERVAYRRRAELVESAQEYDDKLDRAMCRKNILLGVETASMLDVKQAAAVIGVGPKTLSGYCSQGRIKGAVKLRRDSPRLKYYIPPDVAFAMAEKRKTDPVRWWLI